MSGTSKPKCNTSDSGVRYVLFHHPSIKCWNVLSLIGKYKVTDTVCLYLVLLEYEKIKDIDHEALLVYSLQVFHIYFSSQQMSMAQHIKITVSRKTLFEDSFQQVIWLHFFLVNSLQSWRCGCVLILLSPFTDHELSPTRSEAEAMDHIPWRGGLGLWRCSQVSSATELFPYNCFLSCDS